MNDFWRKDIASLYALTPEGAAEPIGLIELSMAGADDRPVADIAAHAHRLPKAGYWYRSLPHAGETKPEPQRFAAMSHPAEYVSGSRFTFILSEENTIYRRDLGRSGGVPAYPADPGAQGWSKLD